MIYKICSRQMWEAAVADGVFRGAEIDLKDGFIHFSSAAQVRETANKHFAGQANLLLIELDENSLGDGLKWEVSRGGDLFPHLYGTFAPSVASNVFELPVGQDGHTFPDSVPA